MCMKDSVEVIDNFLDNIEIDESLNIIHNIGWHFTGTSNDNKDVIFWYSELIESTWFAKLLFEKIKRYFNKDFVLKRVYANGQTFGLDGSFHIDDDNENAYTFILYLSDITPQNIDRVGGFTQFKLDNGVLNVEPFFNRGVLFKSNILHRGLAPSRFANMLRISIAFKMIQRQ